MEEHMRRRVVAWVAVLWLVTGLALAGCGASNGSGGGIYGNSPGSNTTPTNAPTTSTTGPQVTTATAVVSSSSQTILTNSSGRTLYYFKDDSATSSACTGTCIQTWPPLLSSSGTAPTNSALPGILGVLNDANGAQVTYNGHPLYTYAGDQAPGDTHGEGIAGKWHVATPTLAVLSGGGAATPTPTSTCTGYGCY
jgi:predicted lipoprotein with Yx(FWY)xxD motif